MGIHGLWTVLHRHAQPTQPHVWSRKKVAIDASIWVAQARNTTSRSNDDLVGHITTVFVHRILKLLFYNIDAVFVFDGRPSALKLNEMRRRREQEEQQRVAAARRKLQRVVLAQAHSAGLDVTNYRTGDPTKAEKGTATAIHSPSNSRHPSKSPKRQQGAQRKARYVSPKAALLARLRKASKRLAARRLGSPLRATLQPETYAAKAVATFVRGSEELVAARRQHDRLLGSNMLAAQAVGRLYLGPRSALEQPNTDNDRRAA